MAAPSVTLVVAMRVVDYQPMHPNSQIAILVGPNRQREVIGHRTKANPTHRDAGAPRTQRTRRMRGSHQHHETRATARCRDWANGRNSRPQTLVMYETGPDFRGPRHNRQAKI